MPPRALQSLIVYNFSCSSCNAQYVGKTARHLATRIAEHKGVSPRTNVELTAPSFSAIRQHAHCTGHTFADQDFRISAKAKSKYDLSIMEALEIQRTMPSLNTMLSCANLSLFTAS